MLSKLEKKTSIISILLLSLGTFFGAGLAFITQIILARTLGSESFGLFTSTLAIITLISPLAVFGIPQLWLKVFGEEGWNARRWVTPSFFVTLGSTALVIILLLTWALLFNNNYQTQVLIFILSIYILGQVSLELVSSKYQLEENYVRLAQLQLIPHLMRFILVVFFIIFFKEFISAKYIAIIYSIVSIFFTLYAMIQINKIMKGEFLLKGHKEESIQVYKSVKIKKIIKNSWPFSLATFFYLIYFQSDLILVKYFVGNHAAGIYNVAFTIIVAIFLFPSIIYQKFLLSKIHRWANHDKNKLYQVYKKGNILMLTSGIIILMLVLSTSSYIIPLLFGTEYNEAVKILNILAISIPIIFLAHSSGSMLVTKNHMKLKVKYMGTVALINITLNIFVIPIYGAIGASITTNISNVLLLFLYYYGTRKYIFNDGERSNEY